MCRRPRIRGPVAAKVSGMIAVPPVLGFIVALALAAHFVRSRHWPGLALVFIAWNVFFFAWLGMAAMGSMHT